MNDFKLPFFMRLNKWAYLALMIVFFGAGIGLSFLAATKSNNALYFVSIICFLISTFSMTSFFSRIFKYKPKKEVYKTQDYNYIAVLDIVSNLKQNGFEFRKNGFGYVASKIEGKTCYKVSIIENVKEYLNPDPEKTDNTKTKGIDKCTEFVAFEIFSENTDNIYDKAPQLSFAGDKVSYTSFVYYPEKIVECNVIDHLNHEKSRERLFGIVKLVRKE